jgi:hypothetical protein
MLGGKRRKLLIKTVRADAERLLIRGHACPPLSQKCIAVAPRLAWMADWQRLPRGQTTIGPQILVPTKGASPIHTRGR